MSNLLLQKGFYDYVDFGNQSNQEFVEHPLKKLKLNLDQNGIYDVFITNVAEDGIFDLVMKERNLLRIVYTRTY